MQLRSASAVFQGLKITVGLLAACLAGSVGPAEASSPAQPPAAKADAPQTAQSFRIMAFGSSSTQGVGATSPAASYPSQLAHLFDEAPRPGLTIAVVNRGIGGEDIDDMTKRLDTDLQSTKPDLVIWQVGSNDSLRGVSVERFKAELKSGIAAIQSTGAEVMLMEPQWSPKLEAADASNQFIDAVRTVGSEEHVDVVRRFDLMKRWMADGVVSRTELVGPDGLHMTDKGYALLASAVFDEVTAHSLAFRGRLAVASAAKHH